MYIYKNNSKIQKLNFKQIVSSFLFEENDELFKNKENLVEKILNKKVKKYNFYQQLQQLNDILITKYVDLSLVNQDSKNFYKVDVDKIITFIDKQTDIRELKKKTILILILIYLVEQYNRFNSKKNNQKYKEVFFDLDIFPFLMNVYQNKNYTAYHLWINYISYIEQFFQFKTKSLDKLQLNKKQKKLIFIK